MSYTLRRLFYDVLDVIIRLTMSGSDSRVPGVQRIGVPVAFILSQCKMGPFIIAHNVHQSVRFTVDWLKSLWSDG